MASLFQRPVDKRFPDLNRKAHKIGQYFADYPHIIVPPDSIFEFPRFELSFAWCKDNCIGFHACEMIATDKYDYDHYYNDYYETTVENHRITDIGGIPTIYYAFVEEADASMFTLMWC